MPDHIVIEEIDYHRNGVGGVGFFVVKFVEPAEERRMLAVLFPGPNVSDEGGTINGLCAVFDRTKLTQDIITFGINSWRGDAYEPELRQAILAYAEAEFQPVTVGPFAWQRDALRTPLTPTPTPAKIIT